MARSARLAARGFGQPNRLRWGREGRREGTMIPLRSRWAERIRLPIGIREPG